MARPINVLLAGFGGQGLLFAGKLIAEAGLIEGREVSWLPSYGPEMRGGTANCSVCVSDDPIGSPLVLEPDALIAMNQPSADKFIADVAAGGLVIIDSTMVARAPKRDNVTIIELPATKLAEDAGLKGLGNVVLLGRLLAETAFCDPAALDKALAKSVPPKRQHLLEPNRKALEIGRDSAARES
jgi:2-oxoglutarate ferredoxin oxidoreductase subunit gamma